VEHRREVSAPAAMPSRTIAAMPAMSSAVDGWLRAIALAYDAPAGTALGAPTSSTRGMRPIASRYCGKPSHPHVMPRERGAGNVLDASMRPMASRAGAKPTPQRPRRPS
jgi:hypothetical protein